jgi:hypothetical protein
MDNCPVCGRHISDFDMTGREDKRGQRWCVEHYHLTPKQARRARQRSRRPARTD